VALPCRRSLACLFCRQRRGARRFARLRHAFPRSRGGWPPGGCQRHDGNARRIDSAAGCSRREQRARQRAAYRPGRRGGRRGDGLSAGGVAGVPRYNRKRQRRPCRYHCRYECGYGGQRRHVAGSRCERANPSRGRTGGACNAGTGAARAFANVGPIADPVRHGGWIVAKSSAFPVVLFLQSEPIGPEQPRRWRQVASGLHGILGCGHPHDKTRVACRLQTFDGGVSRR
jgi:hypothetical protein